MGMWIYLEDDRGHTEYERNYTHNCNGMANAVLDPDPEYQQVPVAKEVLFGGNISWWQRLNGLSGPEGARLIARIVTGLKADPGRFQAMNPSNGWGDYDSFLKLLEEMLRVVPEWPTKWTVNG